MSRLNVDSTNKETDTEIASTRSTDPEVFELGCFFFPQVRGGTGDQKAMQVSPQGFCLCRQGKGTEGAVLLLRYLTARGGELLSKKLNYISTTRGVTSRRPWATSSRS